MCGLNEIAAWLLERDDIAIICHENPDGDTLGSGIALKLALESLGKRAVVLSSDVPGRVYSFMPGIADIISTDELPFEPAAYISVDVSVLKRMGRYADRFTDAASKIALDHHATNEGFGDLCYVEPKTAAAGEIMLRLIGLLGARISPEIAECLYTAISTDCGNFSFGNTSPDTLNAAAECVKYGADVEKLSRLLFRLRSEGTTRLLGAALSRIEMSPGKKVAMIALPHSEYAKYNCAPADSHAFVNYLNEIEGADIGIMIDEIEGGVKISFRGANGTDVSGLAAVYGGGGHRAAAGAKIFGITLEEAARRVMSDAIAYVKE